MQNTKPMNRDSKNRNSDSKDGNANAFEYSINPEQTVTRDLHAHPDEHSDDFGLRDQSEDATDVSLRNSAFKVVCLASVYRDR